MSEKNKRIDLNDRETIAIGIVRKQPLKKIAGLLGCHVTSISNEIRKHRIFVSGNYYVGNDCRYVKGCDKRNICGDEDCPMFCYACHTYTESPCPNLCFVIDSENLGRSFSISETGAIRLLILSRTS